MGTATVAPRREFVCRVSGFWTPFTACFSTEPKITVKRGPEARLEAVAQVPFKGSNWVLRLGPGACIVDIARPKVGVRGEEPHSKVSIQYPVAPALGIAKFRLEPPSVSAPIDQLRRIVLAGRSHDLEAGSQQDLLLPLYELLGRHGRAALQVYGEAVDRIQQAGSVKLVFRTQYGALKIPNSVWQRGDDVGRSTKEAERVVVAEDRYAVSSGGATDGERAVVVNAAIVEGPGQGDGIGMQGSNDVSARSQSPARLAPLIKPP